MENLSFISDAGFRAVLESDIRELDSAVDAGANKAAHVLAGSVVEALLSDYLVELSASDKTLDPKKILRMDLAQLVEAAHSRKLISDEIRDLSAAIRGYRNLIHPGRLQRQQARVSPDSARVASAVVRMVMTSVGESRQSRLGMTAEQVIRKVESDHSVMPVLGRLVRGLPMAERQRVVLEVLPSVYMQRVFDGPPFDDWPDEQIERHFNRTQAHLATLYDTAFDLLDDDSKRRAMDNLVDVVRTEPETTSHAYEDAFLKGDRLEFLDEDSQGLIAEHVIARISMEGQAPSDKAIDGLASFAHGPGAAKLLREAVTKAMSSSKAWSDYADQLSTLYEQGDEAVNSALDQAIDEAVERRSKWTWDEDEPKHSEDVAAAIRTGIPF